jgi:8-oxo-dGTP pyrophosphatase MutT (NUDIX family)
MTSEPSFPEAPGGQEPSSRAADGPRAEQEPPQDVVAPQPQAAVAIVRTLGDDPHYLVLRRARNPLDPWSGHFALPGGRRDPGDRSLLETCIRETLEETGLALDALQMVSERPWARAGGTLHATLVAPFLFEIPSVVGLTLDETEIAESHWLPSRYLSDPCNHALRAVAPGLPDRLFPCIKVGDGAIWGFTYGVLRELLTAPGWPHPGSG